MLALAALHPVLPFSLELLALRRLTASAFGTLMSRLDELGSEPLDPPVDGDVVDGDAAFG